MSHEKAVFVGEQATGTVVVIGDEECEEWLASEELPAIDLAEMA